jgi:hypothetical protein
VLNIQPHSQLAHPGLLAAHPEARP